MLLQLLPGTGRLLREAAQSPDPVGNGKWKAAADVRRVSTAWQQQLANFSWLLIQISLDESIAINPNVDVQEVDSSCAEVVVKGELDGGVEVVLKLSFTLKHRKNTNAVTIILYSKITK